MVNVWPGTGGLPSLKISPHRLLTSFKRKKNSNTNTEKHMEYHLNHDIKPSITKIGTKNIVYQIRCFVKERASPNEYNHEASERNKLGDSLQNNLSSSERVKSINIKRGCH